MYLKREFFTKIREVIESYKIPIGLSLVGIVLIIGGMIFSMTPEVTYPKESLVLEEKIIHVDIAGAVSKPGVYKLNEKQLIEDAINQAGGFAEGANKDYISKYLNLAQKLSDGMKIYVPFEGELSTSSGQGVVGGVVTGTNSSQRVNINSGTQSELEALPGIGPVTAAKIISGRPYQKIEDLLNQKIISKSTFEKIKSSVVIF